MAMSASLLVQYIVIAVAVLFSAWVVMRKQYPGATRTLRIALALPLLRRTRPGWVRWLGRHVAPSAFSVVGEDCGGCNGCGDGSRSH